MTGSAPEGPRLAAFGRFLLLDEIAVGGMAEVFLARTFDEGPSRLLALKRLRDDLAADPTFTRMFVEEARLAGLLAHPGIVPLREAGRVGGSTYLAMDFVWGKDLFHVVRRCRRLRTTPSAAFAAYVGAELAAALAHAHALRDERGEPLGLVHRDVSPQNVLIGFDGAVRVIDFGVAKAAAQTSHTQTGVLKGKLGYMSPEQARGEPLDGRSDVFAAATCLVELLTLRSLFVRPTPAETLAAIRRAEVPMLSMLRPDVPPALEDVLRRALAPRRDDRWEDAAAFEGALRDALAEIAPRYERSLARAWVRDIFLKEVREEGARLEALERVGRAQLWPAADRVDARDPRLGPSPDAPDAEVMWSRWIDGAPVSRRPPPPEPASAVPETTGPLDAWTAGGPMRAGSESVADADAESVAGWIAGSGSDADSGSGSDAVSFADTVSDSDAEAVAAEVAAAIAAVRDTVSDSDSDAASDSDAVSDSDSDSDSDADAGSVPGSVSGSVSSSVPGSVPGSVSGSAPVSASVSGSVPGSVPVPGSGSVSGSVSGSGSGSAPASASTAPAPASAAPTAPPPARPPQSFALVLVALGVLVLVALAAFAFWWVRRADRAAVPPTSHLEVEVGGPPLFEQLHPADLAHDVAEHPPLAVAHRPAPDVHRARVQVT